MSFRSSEIAVSAFTRWSLNKIAKACSDAQESSDYIGNRALEEWIDTNYPELRKVWEQREELDKLALKKCKPVFDVNAQVECDTRNTRELIVALRGEPSKCDFCQRELPVEQLHPEEAGQWICKDCIDKDPDMYYGKPTKC